MGDPNTGYVTPGARPHGTCPTARALAPLLRRSLRPTAREAGPRGRGCRSLVHEAHGQLKRGRGASRRSCERQLRAGNMGQSVIAKQLGQHQVDYPLSVFSPRTACICNTTILLGRRLQLPYAPWKVRTQLLTVPVRPLRSAPTHPPVGHGLVADIGRGVGGEALRASDCEHIALPDPSPASP